jgi:hypothetical protein
MSASSRRRALLLGLSAAALTLVLAGCASGDGGASSASAPARAPLLPAVISDRWTPPANATRTLDAEPSTVFAAAERAAESLGFAINRRDAARCRLSAARRQSTGFDEARQDTLELTATTRAPGLVEVAVVFREAVESGGMVTSALVRDRAPYDVFFARLAEGLVPAALPVAP